MVGLLAVTVVSISLVNPNTDPTPWIIAIIGIVSATIPGIVAAFFAERVSHDIRGDTLKDKVREGFDEMIDDVQDPHHDRRKHNGR